MLPRLNFNLIDVRDVATAHVKAMTLPEAAGNRHIISNTNHWMTEMGEILAKEFSSQGYNPVTVSYDKYIEMYLLRAHTGCLLWEA